MDSLKMDTAIFKVVFKFLAIAVATMGIILVTDSMLLKRNPGKAKQPSGSFEKNGLRKGIQKRATTPGTPLLFTAQDEQNLVDWHNDYRRQVSPEASNMEYMTWDDQLAGWAQEWTDACYYEHGFPAEADNVAVGQNLWRGFVAVQPDGSGPINSWWNEWQWYDYDTDTCQEGKICGHYTQLVWDTSSKVGCGRSFCAEGYDDTLNFTDNYIVACNYLEQGNKRDEKPYETGASCTRCSSGVMTCDDKLCRQCQDGATAAECSTTCEADCQNCATLNANCTCTCQPQFTDVDCSVPCGNFDANCGTGWPVFTCTGFPGFEFVADECPAMCGQCTPDDGSFVCGDSTNGSTESPNMLYTTTSGVSSSASVLDTEAPTDSVITLSDNTIGHTQTPVIYITTPVSTSSSTGVQSPQSTSNTKPADTVSATDMTITNAPTDLSTNALSTSSAPNVGSTQFSFISMITTSDSVTFESSTSTANNSSYQTTVTTAKQPNSMTTTDSNQVLSSLSSSSSISSTTLTSACSQVACENGGTLDLDACTCTCAEGFQGDECSTPQEEIGQSVLILINTDMNNWIQLQPILQRVIAEVTTDYCNKNFDQCCPNYGTKTNSLQIDFASTNDVYIVGGYPKEMNVGSSSVTQTAVYIKPISMTSLCEEGSNGNTPDSGSPIYVPQDILLTAITEELDLIEAQLNVSIDEVTLGQIEDAKPETSPGLSTAWIVGICLLTVVPLSIVAVSLIVLKMKGILYKQRWLDWQQRHIHPNKVQPVDQRFA